MTSLIPRPAYTDDELRKLYPAGLRLHQVHVFMRHGERTPVRPRFENAGLKAWWPYCSAAQHMAAAIRGPSAHPPSTPIDILHWRRRLETIGPNDSPIVGQDPSGKRDGVCDMGSLTDLGRRTTYLLGQRLRTLYVDRLGFLPATLTPTLADSGAFYFRTTPVKRSMESLHQTMAALYPPSARQPGPDGRFPVPTIIKRTPTDETLYPNETNCQRLASLMRAFGKRTAERWNNSPEMDLINRRLGKWMPEGQRIAVDSSPRLSGVMDTINSSLAHGPETRLPAEFYNPETMSVIDRIVTEEWFAGFKESQEYRMLGMGPMMGDVVQRMVESVENTDKSVRFALNGCHDTTLAGALASMGAFEADKWPPFTSHLAIEMFRETDGKESAAGSKQQQSWWSSLSGLAAGAKSSATTKNPIGRKPLAQLTEDQKKRLDGYYVRMRYNDEVVTVPACKQPGNNYKGDATFCTLAAFKAVVDKFTPTNWQEQCNANNDKPGLPENGPEWAGHY
ncbi:hypothetical protein VTJ04DRAFT_427 [Mycothermus thermophilus]|uniref:uncharacterized protein n=1 Tax=Humicola insolens TaxID=85995 RepID=UPI003741FB9E